MFNELILSLADLSRVEQIYQSARHESLYPIGGEWKSYQFIEELKNQNILGRWREKRQLVAFLVFRDLVDSCDILLLVTDPEFQRQGHMKSLINDFFTAFTGKNIYVEVHEKNISALSLYNDLGFVSKNHIKNFYGPGHHAYLLAKEL